MLKVVHDEAEPNEADPLTHRPPCPPPSRVPSPGYAFPQPLTRVTVAVQQDPPDSSGLTHADIGI